MNNIQELRKIIADSKEGQNEVYILDGVPYYSTARTSPYRSIADIRTIVEQAEENEALKDRVAELEQKLKPSLYWDASNTEISHDSIEELMHCKFEDGAEVGDEVEIQRAVLLPSETYVFTKIDDEDYSCEYELKEHKGDE